MANTNRLLVKMRPQAVALAAASSDVKIRPLYDESPQSPQGFGLTAGDPQWFLAETGDGAATAWDLAHGSLAGQLGVDDSDIVFAEPDLPQSFLTMNERRAPGQPFALGSDCSQANPQTNTNNRVEGPGFGWHLSDDFSQLGSARKAVVFADPRTRIAHIDTGYDKTHNARPERILEALERNFVDGDNNPNSAQDPDRARPLDNSGHGTGTIGILAGRMVPDINDYLGGAPGADILPLRIADSVVLFYVSAFAEALQYAIQNQADVVSISMGGLPSSAWNDAVNSAYEAGICIVAASGDCIGGLPSHHVVYPARYHRTIAACGVMEDGKPYYNITAPVIEGSWGPDSSMTAALSSYTPNIPWARIGCPNIIDQDGQGTSACTPQIAAAVALWYEKYKSVLPRDWRRVEAVRNALFQSAKPGDKTYFGRGILQARKALDIAPVLNLTKTPPDSDSFSFFRVLTGLGLADTPSPREAMFNLELSQIYLQSSALQDVVPDPELPVSQDQMVKFMDIAIAEPKASVALRKQIASRYPMVAGKIVQGAPAEIVNPQRAACAQAVTVTPPATRRIRAYAVDPSFSTRLETAHINEITIPVRWEKLEPGPKGEYIEVIDVDPTGQKYDPVDLNDPRLLAQDGFAPAEGNPAFHQQMAYAVSMTTISYFEQALGRPVLWRPAIVPDRPSDDSQYVPALKIYPHALHEANAYYSPQKVGLLFGYFEAKADDPGDHVPGSSVYTCVSHDIVAHETTHAILDGMHRHFNEPSNPDVLALHEGFADIVALMQHFAIPEILRSQIAKVRGDIAAESMLGSLAVQFGHAIGARGALRNAIGKTDANGVWQRIKPDPADYQKVVTPHERGALLVAAVFDAFLAIYKTRSADLMRIYTGGTGVLAQGAIHPDMVNRLADEATTSARHVLNMCIRALDYIPPVDVTFTDYLRGILTGDADLFPDDPLNYRLAFVESFRRRGIYDPALGSLSLDTLLWKGVDFKTPPPQYSVIIAQLKRFADACFYVADRKTLFEETRKQRAELHGILKRVFTITPGFAQEVGLDPSLPHFEVHELRRAVRTRPDGRPKLQAIVALTQNKDLKIDGVAQPRTLSGGSTIIVDLSAPAIQFAIIKAVNSPERQQTTAAFLKNALADPLQALMLMGNQKEPFAALHSFWDVNGRVSDSEGGSMGTSRLAKAQHA